MHTFTCVCMYLSIMTYQYISMPAHTNTHTHTHSIPLLCPSTFQSTEIPTIIDPTATINHLSATGSIILGISAPSVFLLIINLYFILYISIFFYELKFHLAGLNLQLVDQTQILGT